MSGGRSNKTDYKVIYTHKGIANTLTKLVKST